MSRYRGRIKLGAGVMGAMTAALLVASTSPAVASGTYSGRAYLWGNGNADTYYADWDDEGLLGRSKHASSNATCLWQRILWADGELASTSDIDGVFGDRTHNATVAWQKDENNRSSGHAGLLTDGGVGPQSFGWAYSMHLWKAGGSESVGQTLNLRYDGTHHDFDLRRIPDGTYEFVDGDGAWRKAGYDYRTCS